MSADNKFSAALTEVDALIMALAPDDAEGLRKLRWRRRLVVRQKRVAKDIARRLAKAKAKP